MHILIGLITAIGGLIWAFHSLQRSGVDLNSFNPFFWIRRRRWEKQLGTKAAHNLERPVEAAALLLIGVAKIEGEITREQKREVISIFENEFNMDKENAAELFSASSYLLQDVTDIQVEVKAILAPCKDRFQNEQSTSFISMLKQVASIDGAPNEQQNMLVNTVKQELFTKPMDVKGW
ncbi:TerB family tellurite resistance protein [Motiliproteus sp. MSK22-1]|uniref:TerB family tellurite resistance protein n=1 Tax=Motiliproteus sp. MSK22-1 TaxID=1897630 RepID=UPI00097671CC|nr:TerB family tellurite resistance protein [Motiliproteus sp. MSK22-1]OMH31665.1 hypothetical protein BGP75_16175 [Motiliproteus sp. MSK22-1]